MSDARVAPTALLSSGLPSETRVRGFASALIALGFAGALGAALADGPSRLWSGVLVGAMVPVWLAIGALFFVSVHSLCGAMWTAPLRRLMEGLGAGLPLAFVAMLALGLFGLGYTYEWAGPHRESFFHAADGTKAAWMQPWRWTLLVSVAILVWMGLRWRLNALSIAQDSGADITARHVRWSVASLLILAPTFTLFTWDTLLSLHVNWVSALWGGYCFVGAVQVFLGTLILVAVWMRRRALSVEIRTHHLHDLGTWILAWSAIVAYFTYAQYTIISYANIDEETFVLVMRRQHGYHEWYLLAIALRCVLPFVLLMSQRFRAHPIALGVAAGSALLGNLLDLTWFVVPAFHPNAFTLPWAEVAIAAGFVGGTLLLTMRFWRRHGLIARGEPNLTASINAEHLH